MYLKKICLEKQTNNLQLKNNEWQSTNLRKAKGVKRKIDFELSVKGIKLTKCKPGKRE